MTDSGWITMLQASEILGLSRRTTADAALRGTLRTERVGRAYLTRAEWVEEYRRDHLGKVGRPRNSLSADQ